MIIDTGDYIIHFFNAYGQRLRDHDCTAGCYTEAVSSGESILELLGNPEDPKTIRSFTVDRRVYNSIDKHERW